jgi:hypothetical protein
MAPVGEEGSADVAAGPADATEGPGGLGSGKSSYVPPHLRNGGAASGAGDRMGGGKYERDDLATLRVTNVSLLLPPWQVYLLLTCRAGFGDGRRTRTSRYVRKIWSGHSSLPCKGSGDWSGEGLCLYQFRGEDRCS